MPEAQASGDFAALGGHHYVNLTTFRRSGAAVVTPVWFALEGGKVYVVTTAEAGKIKRIRNNPQVQLAPSTGGGKALGPAVEAVARLLPPGEWTAATRALNAKYGWRKRLFDVFFRLRQHQRAYLEIRAA